MPLNKKIILLAGALLVLSGAGYFLFIQEQAREREENPIDKISSSNFKDLKPVAAPKEIPTGFPDKYLPVPRSELNAQNILYGQQVTENEQVSFSLSFDINRTPEQILDFYRKLFAAEGWQNQTISADEQARLDPNQTRLRAFSQDGIMAFVVTVEKLEEGLTRIAILYAPF